MNVPHHVEVDIQTPESGHVWKFYLIRGLKKLCFFLLTHWSLGDLDAILKTAISNLVLLIGFFISSNDNAPRWMPLDLTDDKSTLVQVMDWCRQATSHYLSQWWPCSMSPYGVTRPQWVEAYSVSPIYRGRVYRGIGYIAVACWTPFFGAQERYNSLDPIRGRQFFTKSAHRDSLCSRFARDNFSRNQLKPTCQYGLEHMLCDAQPR